MSTGVDPIEPAEVIARHSRSFSIASRFLPRRVRSDVHALYAWCRAVDDCVDRAADRRAAANELARIREDIHRIRRGEQTLQHPASRWIAPLIRGGRVDPDHALDLVDGMQLDLDGFLVRSEADLRRYCYHAAGCVGLMLSSVMGVTDRAARRHAIALGIAMQMTNIARDVREDAESGRCYLPGLRTETLFRSPEKVRPAVRRLLAAAEREYRLAGAGLRYLPDDCRPAIRVALAAYREIGREILRRELVVWNARIVVPKWRLAAVVATAVLGLPESLSLLAGEEFDRMKSEPTETGLNQSRHAVYLGLSLTSFMAAALFVLVYINPKDASYGWLPIVYAAAAVVTGGIFNALARAQESSDGRV
jgi:phytoene synthase